MGVQSLPHNGGGNGWTNTETLRATGVSVCVICIAGTGPVKNAYVLKADVHMYSGISCIYIYKLYPLMLYVSSYSS